MTLQAHVSEVQHHRLSHRQPDQVDTLAVVGVVIRPVGRDDDAFTVSKGSTATGITWHTRHEIRGRFRLLDVNRELSSVPGVRGTEGDSIVSVFNLTDCQKSFISFKTIFRFSESFPSDVLHFRPLDYMLDGHVCFPTHQVNWNSAPCTLRY